MAGRNYFLWADTIRIVAIYLVVSVHLSFLPDKIQASGLIYFIHFAIAKSSVPLFVMLSGALLLPKKESISFFYKKRFKRILIPWMFWSIIFIPFLSLPYTLSGLKSSLQSFWFMPLVAGLYLLTPYIRPMVQQSKTSSIIFLCILWFIGVAVFPYYNQSAAFPFSIDTGIVRQVASFIGYFILGYLIIDRLKLTIKHLTVGLFFGVLGVGIVVESIFAKGGTTQNSLFYFEYLSPGIVLTSIGIYLILIFVSRLLENLKQDKKKIIMAISTSSFGVYFAHQILIAPLKHYLQLTNFPFQNMIVSILVTFTITTLLILALKKVPVIGKVVS